MEIFKKKVFLMGFTGSIGKQVLQVSEHASEEIEIIAVSFKNNLKSAIDLINKHPSIMIVGCENEESSQQLKQIFPYLKIYSQNWAHEIFSNFKFDFVINAVSSYEGIKYSFLACRYVKKLAIANKESYVVAGHYLKQLAKKHECELLPIDSEHTSIHLVFKKINKDAIKKIFITCSGGPFREFEYEQLKNVSLKQALNHPTWNMGSKISIDSATLMNKVFEIVETKYLFDLDIANENIQVIIHPQSIIHCVIQLKDNTYLFVASLPSMEVAIQQVLCEKIYYEPVKEIDFNGLSYLFFSNIKPWQKKVLATAYMMIDNSYLSLVMNVANDTLVDLFLKEKISYIKIYDVLEIFKNKYEKINKLLDNEDVIFKEISKIKKEVYKHCG